MDNLAVILNFNQLEVLKTFLKNRDLTNYNEFTAPITIQELMEITGFSHTTIRNTIRFLVENNMITNGLKKGRAKTYYLTKEGIMLLRKTIKGMKEGN